MRYLMMGVRGRSAIPGYLAAHIPGLEFVWDTTGDAVVTWQHMLQAIGETAAVSLEDDVILTRNFCAKAEAAIAKRPGVLIQFHSRSADDLDRGSRWRSAITFYNNQCLYYPPGWARACLQFAYSWGDWIDHATGYDRCMAAFMQATKQRYWNHCPSLVEHAPLKSLIDPRRSSKRRSCSFADAELDGLPAGIY